MTTDNTTDNFWAAWAQVPDVKPLKIFYRLYYDDNGNPLFYSMEDLPGNYIDIDATTYAESPSQVKVINNELVRVTTQANIKLAPSAVGVACDPRDVCVVVSESQPHIKWSVHTYESN